MLSIENNTSDPSSSCRLSELKSNDRFSDELALQEADLPKAGYGDNRFCSNFSIRDYVFTARGKDVETNWPFPQQYLRLCLKHGIKNPLPPFETPDLVRNGSFRKGIASNQLVSCVDNTFDQENVNFSNQVSCSPIEQPESPLRDKKKFDVGSNSKDTSSCCLSKTESLNQANEREILPTFHTELERTCYSAEASIGIEVAGSSGVSQKTSKSLELSGKKCRFVLKFGAISDTNCREDIGSIITTELETMASKICPVCKTFSSTSNTTLNAHIDQCLAVESTSKWAMNSKSNNHRVKPRKIRSMVDIYSTAPRCTLEELNRRNGSNWATDLSLPMATPNAEVFPEEKEKRQRLSSVDLGETGNDNAVYIDSNGTKLRIISKLNDAPVVPFVGVNAQQRKNMKNCKESKIISTCKRSRLALKHSKYMKFKVQSKKLRSLDLDRSEIVGKQNRGAPDGNHGSRENHKKEESPSPILRTCEKMKSTGSGSLRQWVCSKQTALSKKYKIKDSLQGQGYPPPMVTRDPFIESNQSNIKNSSVKRSRIMKIRKSSENLIFSKSKRMESESRGNVEKSQGTTENSLNPSRFVGASCPKTKRIDIPSKGYHLLPPNGKKVSTKRKNMLLNGSFLPKSKSIRNEGFSSSKMSCMHRSMEDLGDRVSALPSDVDEQCDLMSDYMEDQSCSLNQKRDTQKSECYVLDLAKTSDFHVSTDQFHPTSDFSKSEGLEYGSGEVSIYGEGTVTEPFSGKAVPSFVSIGEHTKCVCGTESWVGPNVPNLSDDDINGEKSDLGTEVDCRVDEGKSFSEVDPIPIPGPPGSFLPSFGDISSEVLQENSSLTSSMVVSSQDRNVLADRDSSGSPVSTTSSLERSNGHSTIQDKFMSSFSYGSSAKASTGDEKFNREDNVIFFPVKDTGDQRCCCSRKEVISRGVSQVSRQNIETRMVFPSMEKKMSFNPNFKPEIFTSFTNYPRFRAEEMVPVSEFPEETTSKRASDSAANCSSHGYFDSVDPSSQTPSKSTPNPVLRLMGKNLMVVNKTEDVSIQIEQPSSGNVLNQPGFCFSNGSRGGRIDSQNRHKRMNRKPNPPFHYHVERIIPHAQVACDPIQEVIIIDGSPEKECDSSLMNTKYTKGLKGSSMSDTHTLIPGVPDFKPGPGNTHSCYQSQRPKPNSLVSCPEEMITSAMKQGISPTDSRLIWKTPFMVQPPSKGHLPRAMYYAS